MNYFCSISLTCGLSSVPPSKFPPAWTVGIAPSKASFLLFFPVSLTWSSCITLLLRYFHWSPNAHHADETSSVIPASLHFLGFITVSFKHSAMQPDQSGGQLYTQATSMLPPFFFFPFVTHCPRTLHPARPFSSISSTKMFLTLTPSFPLHVYIHTCACVPFTTSLVPVLF